MISWTPPLGQTNVPFGVLMSNDSMSYEEIVFVDIVQPSPPEIHIAGSSYRVANPGITERIQCLSNPESGSGFTLSYEWLFNGIQQVELINSWVDFTEYAAGITELRVIASNVAFADTASITLEIFNRAPTLEPIRVESNYSPDDTWDPGSHIDFFVMAADENGDALTVHWEFDGEVSSYVDYNFMPNSVASWAELTLGDMPGDFPLVVRVSDAEFEATRTFMVHVR